MKLDAATVDAVIAFVELRRRLNQKASKRLLTRDPGGRRADGPAFQSDEDDVILFELRAWKVERCV